MCIRDRFGTNSTTKIFVKFLICTNFGGAGPSLLSTPEGRSANHGPSPSSESVSYTHLDVYKRQGHGWLEIGL